MESKLKTLKVADLRDILAKAQQPSPPTKAAKADLVARILASKEATDVYNAKFGPKDDLLAPPEDLDWDVDQVNPPETPTEQSKPEAVAPVAKPASAAAATKPAPTPAPATTPAAPAPAADAPPAAATEDIELEKRRQRAARFGVPLVEPRQPTVKKTAAPAAAAATKKLPDVPEKLDARAARFGTSQKRPAPAEEVDAEEQERRRKRAERFGTGGEAKA